MKIKKKNKFYLFFFFFFLKTLTIMQIILNLTFSFGIEQKLTF